MANELMFVSPVAGWKGDVFGGKTAVSQPTLTLSDHSANGKLSVQGTKAAEVLQAAHLGAGQGMETEQGQVYRLRHNLFYISTPPDGVATANRTAQAAINQSGEFVTVTDVTNGRFEFHLSGLQSAELLSRLCGLNFHHFPNLAAQQSSVAKTTQLIIRRDIDNIPTYSLIGARSFGWYVWETILKAGADMGI